MLLVTAALVSCGDSDDTHVNAAVESGDFTAFEDGTVDAIVDHLQAQCAPTDS